MRKYDLFMKDKIIQCNAKQLLKINPKLVVDSNGFVLYELENVQSLYLFPLTVIDYIENLTRKNIICINIIDVNCNLDYKQIFDKDDFDNLKSVEILIRKDYDKKRILKICDMIKYFYRRRIMISLNIKNLVSLSNLLSKQFKYVTYFKIFLDNDINYNAYIEFLNKLSIVNRYKQEKTLVHIKTYLSIEKAKIYEKMLNDFVKLNVDTFQVSKELLPINKVNSKVDTKTQQLIRDLELKYYDYYPIKFISVKDLTTLYYPRFELDDRNSKKCYSCYMKPYLFDNKILPCKVNKVLDNLNEWSSDCFNLNEYNNIIKKCGIKCTDCASIFENDMLYNVENIIKNYENTKFYFIKEN